VTVEIFRWMRDPEEGRDIAGHAAIILARWMRSMRC